MAEIKFEVSSKDADKLLSKILEAIGKGLSDLDFTDEIVADVMEVYKTDMILYFNDMYAPQIKYIKENYNVELSDLSNEVLDKILSGEYEEAIKVHESNGVYSIEVDPPLAFVAGIMEYGNTELPPMRHWDRLERQLITTGANTIKALIREKIAENVNRNLKKVKA